MPSATTYRYPLRSAPGTSPGPKAPIVSSLTSRCGPASDSPVASTWSTLCRQRTSLTPPSRTGHRHRVTKREVTGMCTLHKLRCAGRAIEVQRCGEAAPRLLRVPEGCRGRAVPPADDVKPVYVGQY